MQIINSTLADKDFILDMYNIAIEYQKARSLRSWLPFDPAMVEEEIGQKKQWKIVDGDTIVCIFLTAYEDPFIWGEKNKDPSVYIHRIVTHPDFHGNNYTMKIIEWAKQHAKENGKQFLRMDTWGDNPRLIDYYINCGFNYIETLTPENTKHLPKHYSCISLSLFEIEVG
ncbi:MAG: GNAT family N-acetyltransferase [Chitinophagaceae bacterium]|nr:GNAT family N-acetyltransferase [Chitinophagaceae bacterium]